MGGHTGTLEIFTVEEFIDVNGQHKAKKVLFHKECGVYEQDARETMRLWSKKNGSFSRNYFGQFTTVIGM